MSADAEHEAFRTRRDRTVRAAQGPLALIATVAIGTGTTIEGRPGTWSTTPSGDGVALTATAADGVTVDGMLVDGTVLVHPHDGMTPSRVRFDDDVTAYVLQRPQGMAVRLWDSESDAMARFRGFEVYDFDPAWVVEATFEPAASQATLGSSQGHERTETMAGVVTFEHAGERVSVLALPSGDSLQLVFSDATTGTETYGTGRFAFVQPRRDGSVRLDLNRAVLPPCAMSDQFDCPLPPQQNRLPFAVTAGERHVRWAAPA